MAGPSDPIGIIAGSGSLPVEGARLIIARGGSVHVCMVDGLADPSLAKYPHTVVNWAQVGRTMSALKKAGVRDVVMLGATGRPSFRNARPDFAFLAALPSILAFLNAGGDDAVLRGLVRLFERHGLRIVSPAAVLPEMLIKAGPMTGIAPSDAMLSDVARGFEIVRALGPYDVGQGTVVIGGAVVAIEGAEGTDRMLRQIALRTGSNDERRAGVLVKRPKPGQDMRVDLPTIGPKTVDAAATANLAGIAVMADNVLAAEPDQLIALANARGLFVNGFADSATSTVQPASPAAAWREEAHTGTALPASERSDAYKAAGILSVLDGLHTGTALVVFDNRVIAIGADEPAQSVVERAAHIRRPRRRKGLAAIGPRSTIDDGVVQAAHAANLAGLIVVGGRTRATVPQSSIALARALGLFLVGLVGEGA